MPPLAVLRERENVFKLLSGTDPNDLQKSHKAFTINPMTRYSNLNHVQSVNAGYLKKLYDTDDPENADYTLPEPVVSSRFEIGHSATMPPPRSKRKSSKLFKNLFRFRKRCWMKARLEFSGTIPDDYEISVRPLKLKSKISQLRTLTKFFVFYLQLPLLPNPPPPQQNKFA